MSVDPEQQVPQPVEQVQMDQAAMGIHAILHAINVMAGKAAMSQSAAEAKDFMQASLFGAQTLITLDPTRLQGGDTPEGRAAAAPPRLPPTKDGDHDGRIGS
jgi:hypothetical protein